jgi:hypothetical protein
MLPKSTFIPRKHTAVYASGYSFLARPASIGGAGSIHSDAQAMDAKNGCAFKAAGSFGLPRGPAPNRFKGLWTLKNQMLALARNMGKLY